MLFTPFGVKIFGVAVAPLAPRMMLFEGIIVNQKLTSISMQI